MIKKSLIAIAMLAFLAATVQAADIPLGPGALKYDDHWPWTYTELDVCCIPIYMDVGYYVWINCADVKLILKQIDCGAIGKSVTDDFPCYRGCTTFQILANFEVKLGCRVDAEGYGVLVDKECSLDKTVVGPTTSGAEDVEVCVNAWNTNTWAILPGDEVRVGRVCITAKPNG